MTVPAKKPPTYQELKAPKGATTLNPQGLATQQQAPCQNIH